MREHQSVSTLSNVEQTLIPDLDIFESVIKYGSECDLKEEGFILPFAPEVSVNDA